MAKIPLAEDRVVFSGAQFQQSQQQDVTQPMVEALHQWGVRRREEYEAAAMERVTQAATRRQQEAGLDSVVTAPSRWARGYQEAFNKQAQRSEEHTSELQSRGHLVCRRLLEKNT